MDARRAFADLPPGATLPRHRFTVADVFAMQDAGVIQDGQVELLGGELVTMAAKKNDHEIVKNDLAAWLILNLPRTLRVAVETTLYLGPGDAPEPDIMVYSRQVAPEDVSGPDVLLLVEVANESLRQDFSVKAALYASALIGSYWVINAVSREVHVHEGPSAAGTWQSVRRLSPNDQLPSVAGSMTGTMVDLLSQT